MTHTCNELLVHFSEQLQLSIGLGVHQFWVVRNLCVKAEVVQMEWIIESEQYSIVVFVQYHYLCSVVLNNSSHNNDHNHICFSKSLRLRLWKVLFVHLYTQLTQSGSWHWFWIHHTLVIFNAIILCTFLFSNNFVWAHGLTWHQL